MKRIGFEITVMEPELLSELMDEYYLLAQTQFFRINRGLNEFSAYVITWVSLQDRPVAFSCQKDVLSVQSLSQFSLSFWQY